MRTSGRRSALSPGALVTAFMVGMPLVAGLGLIWHGITCFLAGEVHLLLRQGESVGRGRVRVGGSNGAPYYDETFTGLGATVLSSQFVLAGVAWLLLGVLLWRKFRAPPRGAREKERRLLGAAAVLVLLTNGAFMLPYWLGLEGGGG